MITARIMIAADAAPSTDLPFASVIITFDSNRFIRSSGILAMILIIRMIEIPFPTPFSVILSPNHIRSAEPAVMVTTAVKITRKYCALDEVSPNNP